MKEQEKISTNYTFNKGLKRNPAATKSIIYLKKLAQGLGRDFFEIIIIIIISQEIHAKNLVYLTIKEI